MSSVAILKEAIHNKAFLICQNIFEIFSFQESRTVLSRFKFHGCLSTISRVVGPIGMEHTPSTILVHQACY